MSATTTIIHPKGLSVIHSHYFSGLEVRKDDGWWALFVDPASGNSVSAFKLSPTWLDAQLSGHPLYENIASHPEDLPDLASFLFSAINGGTLISASQQVTIPGGQAFAPGDAKEPDIHIQR